MIDTELQKEIEKDRQNYCLYNDEDRKLNVLAEHLGEDPEDLRLSAHTDHLYILGGSMRRSGSPPSHWRQLAEEIREILSAANYLEQTYQEVIEIFRPEYDAGIRAALLTDRHKHDYRGEEIPESKRREYLTSGMNDLPHYAYGKLKSLMPSGDLHKYVNGLYFLLTDPGDRDYQTYHYNAIKAAFNGEEIEDTRPIYPSDGGQYLVLTDPESDQELREYIEQSVWAFNPHFLSGETNLPYEVFEGLSERCEDSNDAILALINQTCGLDDFCQAAAGEDGRGHFLAGYDSHETEIRDDISGETFYIYRTN